MLDKYFKENEMHHYEDDCYWCKPDIPNHELIILFVALDKNNCPIGLEDEYYIVTWTGDVDGERIPHRISLTEPKYIYDSDPIPEEYRSRAISIIKGQYTDGINKVNEYGGNFDPDAMPDYDLLQ